MQWNTDTTTQRIDCEAADLIDRLYAEQLPPPCKRTPQEVWDILCEHYPVALLPESDIRYARTALSVLETHYADDADYLPHDEHERLEGARMHLPRLQLRCGVIENTGVGSILYRMQKEQFEQRAGRFGLVWRETPIYVSVSLKSGYTQVIGSQYLSDQVTVWTGVSAEEIADRSPELLAYLRAKHALDEA